MAEIGSRRETRARHEQARHLRACGYTWAQIADHLGYRTRSGAQRAVERLYARTRETPDVARRSLVDGLELTKSLLFERLADPKNRNDVSAITALSREIRTVTAEAAKLDGLHAAQKIDVSVTQLTTVQILSEYERKLLDAIDAEVVGEIEQ